jgi:hypothetical protein
MPGRISSMVRIQPRRDARAADYPLPSEVWQRSSTGNYSLPWPQSVLTRLEAASAARIACGQESGASIET